MIQTDRLLLRRWREGDQAQVSPILGDPEVMRFSDHGPLTEKGQNDWFLRACARAEGDLSSGPLAITLRSDSRPIGYIRLSRDPKRVRCGDAEIGFRLARHAWGQGYATEAASMMIKSAMGIPKVSRVVAIIDPHNRGSVRVVSKLGMVQEGEIMFDGYDYPDALYVTTLYTEASTT